MINEPSMLRMCLYMTIWMMCGIISAVIQKKSQLHSMDWVDIATNLLLGPFKLLCLIILWALGN